MSHAIYTAANGQASMAFTGQVPWHGLGQRLQQDATIEEWAKAAGFDFTIKAAPVTYTDESGVTRNLMGQQVLYASDNGQGLSTVSDGFQVVQPMEILEFFRDFIGAGGYRLHTAGMLNERRRFWAMAKNGEGSTAEVVPGDQIRLNILAATAADGTMRTTIKPTSIRVVCANTLGMSLKDGRQAISVSHKSKFNADEAKAKLAHIYPAFQQHVDAMRQLAVKRFSPDQAKELLMLLLAKPQKAPETTAQTDKAPIAQTLPAIANVDAGSPLAELLARDRNASAIKDEPKDPRAVAKVLALFNGAGRGANHEGVHGTGWGLVNALSEYTDWQQGRTANNRIDSAWFGKSDELKTEFVKLLQAA